jgi:hypothetical protein
LQEALENATTADSNHVSEFLEKVRAKDMIIEGITGELRQLKSTVKSQETSVAYFKKRVEELNM